MQSIKPIIGRVLLSLSLVLIATSIKAQISSNAFYTEPTQYGGGAAEDPIFFYTDINTATLTAPGGATYQWYQYSTATSSFEPIVGATTATLSNITERGYRVDVDAQPYYCWNFVPVPQIDSIGVPFASCDNLRLTAYTQNKTLAYYRHVSDNGELTVDYGHEWTSVPAGPVSDEDNYTRFIDAPTDDSEYSVVVGNKFASGIVPVQAGYAYVAIAVEAKFSHETEGTADNEATEGSAPMIVRFTDESLGKVTDWEWTFGEAGKDFVADPIFTFQKYAEDGYPVVLYVKNSESECESETAPVVFTVNEMSVKVPNAFTPFSSPGQNDEFRVSYRSVNKFTMLIYNRWGRKVYSSSNPEVGWDGRIGNSKAEPGVYFYKIEATGYNPGEKEELEGAVHLIVN
ncbi:T9SS type B sorting domain-containing protein [Carboxylicivirga marina]|uniref:Gliding motility-associated C-terminal domain-containing protein n=1 Tax=Carboxylicivirga marina TaxID=2800988 RepID=A0ABS1HKF8_9BACT|nr:gliding motility-associated C-terminal domain-containing protein [Carboxylicivirga marina]MBK3518163.1 gliding motility-associated C-terminal domain-containing protein [Carboxylicivirga marina]